MQFKEKRTRSIQLDITPIVDMVFNLLIFFALSINFSSAAALNLRLPAASTLERAPHHAPVLQISQDLRIMLDREAVSLALLPETMAAQYRQSDSRSIIIMADEAVPHGFVVSVMDVCRQAGADKISISVRIQ
jgi:biopolymer transport protein ExbD